MLVTSIFATSLALALCIGASAQSPLTTVSPFSANNAGSPGGAVYFDLTAGAADLQVTAFDINCNDGVGGNPVAIDVYWRVGTSISAGNSPTGWFFHGSDSGGISSSVIDTPTNLPLAKPLCIPAGMTLGLAIVCKASFGHAYSDGPPGPFGTAELTLTGGEASNVPFSGSLFSPRVPNLNIYYSLGSACTLYTPSDIVAVAESAPFSGTLSSAGGTFSDGEYLRWNFTDPLGSNAGLPGVMVINLGTAGSAPIGVTAAIPGFNQVWAGSNPFGLSWFFPTSTVGGPDTVLPVPVATFFPGDTVRIQGLILDAAHATGFFPLVPTPSSVEFVHQIRCQVTEDFDTLVHGKGVYPLGWSNGGGVDEWRVDGGGTSSSGTGPSNAVSGTNYMFCETSYPRVLGDLFVMNTPAYASSTLVAGNLTFQLSRVGATIGTLEVRMGDGSGTFPTLLATYSGPGIGQWEKEALALPTPLPANVQFQFRYACGTSYTGDIALDDVCLQ